MNISSDFNLYRSRIVAFVGLAFGYFALAAFSVTFTRFEGGTAFIWTASALLFGTLVASRREYWRERILACAIGSFVATWQFSIGLVPGLFLAAINVGEVIVAIALLQWARPSFSQMDTIADLAWIILATALVAPLASSLPGAFVITAYTPIPLFENWLAWVSGHSLGMLIFGPIAVLVADVKLRDCLKLFRQMSVVGVFLLLLLAAISGLVFSFAELSLMFLLVPLLVLNTFLLGRLGSIVSLMIVFAMSTALSIEGLGPIGSLPVSAAEKAFALQLFLASASLTTFPLAAELAMRKSLYNGARNEAAFYGLALKCSSDLIIECDTRGGIRLASASAEKILDVPADLLVGGNILDLVHPADERLVREKFADFLKQERLTISMEYRLHGHGKTWGWFECHARRITDENGRKSGIIAVLRDISDRKEDKRANLVQATA